MSALSDPNNIDWVPVEEEENISPESVSAVLAETPSGVVIASAVHTGTMIALVPSAEDAARLALVAGEEVADLHLTLAFLGEAANIDDLTWNTIINECGDYFTGRVETEAFSVNVFNPHDAEMDTALVLGVRGETMVEQRAQMLDSLSSIFEIPTQYAPWVPHITLAYNSDMSRVVEAAQKLGPVIFDRLRFARGGEVVDIPLSLEAVLATSTNDSLTAAVSRLDPDLRRYWLGPQGSARVGGWGNPGSFRACQREMRKEGVEKRYIDGLCANLYHEATGHSPGRKKEENAASVVTANAELTIASEFDQGGTLPEEIPSVMQWEGVLTLEGVESGDGRMFALGALSWARLPLPLMYQPVSQERHQGSVQVGLITAVARRNNQLYGWGVIDLGAKINGYDVGKEVYRLMSEEFLTGISVDVDSVRDVETTLNTDGSPRALVYHTGRIRGATLVAIPAFDEARVFLTDEVLLASAFPTLIENSRIEEPILIASSHTITIPDLPPAWWFDEPADVPMHGALTVTDEGRVYGLLAPARTTHRSRKTTVPVRNVDYSRFMGRETIVAGGGRVITGVITSDCGHAPSENYGTLANRIDHYDNSCSIVANIRIGETKDHAVWVAGAIHPFATAEQVARMLSCTLSGDWQPHPDRPGIREFIAALLVPVPGFAMMRKEPSVVYDAEGMLTASVVPIERVKSDVEELRAVREEFLWKHLRSVRASLMEDCNV